MSRTGLVIVSSTRAAAGEYEDRSGPIAVEFLRNQGLKTPDPIVVADADIFTAVEQALRSDDEPAVLLTSGGTGISPEDLTVENRKSTRLNSSHVSNSYAVFCLKIKTIDDHPT